MDPGYLDSWVNDLDSLDNSFISQPGQVGRPVHSSTFAPSEFAETQSKNDADELSRTAGHLLDNLKNESSLKFQQSNFLALMRQFRDKEVRVEGDKIVNVSAPSSQLNVEPPSAEISRSSLPAKLHAVMF